MASDDKQGSFAAALTDSGVAGVFRETATFTGEVRLYSRTDVSDLIALLERVRERLPP